MMKEQKHTTPGMNLESSGDLDENVVDVIIVGAGISGLYMLHKLREQKLSIRVVEAGSGVGGTWFWNRYPGARCDVESMQYSYSFSEELQQEWHWNERYSSQGEILRYLNYVADKFDLRRDIQLETRVTTITFDDNRCRWHIQTDRGDRFSARFCIMATGCLSKIVTPNIAGLASFKGRCYFTGQWPHDDVDFTGRRVAVIGTGSSGIQTIPMVAERAAHVFVVQRTPSFSVPARNRPMDADYEQQWKSDYVQRRCQARQTPFGICLPDAKNCPASTLPLEEQCEEYERQWQLGGLQLLFSFTDTLIDRHSNDVAADFVRGKIRATVKDSSIAEALLPHDYPLGAKRLCVDTRYFETFNRDNVTLVDLRHGGIEAITPTGLRIGDKTYEVDDIVFATGFDAITGALLDIDIRGRAGKALKDKWTEGPRTYLGIMMNSFPNLFTITGPGSPSVFTNMFVAIEQHVEWIAGCIEHLRAHDYDAIEANVEEEDAWFDHVNQVGAATLFACANVKSWYNGKNIAGKTKVLMPYIGGFDAYRQKCDAVVAHDYEGFTLTKRSGSSADDSESVTR